MTIPRVPLPGDHLQSLLRNMQEQAPSQAQPTPHRHQLRTAQINHAMQAMEEMIQRAQEATREQRAALAQSLWRRVTAKGLILPSLFGVSLKSNKLCRVDNNSNRLQVSSSTPHSRDKSLSGIMELHDRHNSLKVLNTSCKPKLQAWSAQAEKIPF
jgi:hypothetical protein